MSLNNTTNNSFDILTDANIDLEETIILDNNIIVLPIEFDLDGKRYLHYSDFREMNSVDFNSTLLKRKSCTINPISAKTYIQYIKKSFDDNKDVLFICSSSRLSTNYINLMLAKDILRKQYKERKLYIYDSESISSQLSLIVMNVILEKSLGNSIESVFSNLTNIRKNCCSLIYMDSFTRCIDSYRLDKNQIKNLNTFLNQKGLFTLIDGKITFVEKLKNSEYYYQAIYNFIKENIKYNKNGFYDNLVIISYAANEMEAINLANKIKSNLNVKNILLNNMSLIVNSYLDTNSMIISFIKKNTN